MSISLEDDYLEVHGPNPFGGFFSGCKDAWEVACDKVVEVWDDFVDALPLDPSYKYTIAGTPLQNGRIGCIMGMNCSPEDSHAHALYIQEMLAGRELDVVYNATHSAAVDVLEVMFLNYFGYSPPARLLVHHWKRFDRAKKDDPDAKYLQICHSQGACHVKNALRECAPELRDRVIVLAIAPAEVVPKHLCYESYNYASMHDFIPFIKIANRNELVVLEPHSEASGLDHGFRSPTYTDVLQGHIGSYLEEHELKQSKAQDSLDISALS